MSIFIFQEKALKICKKLINNDLNKMNTGFVISNYVSLIPK